MDIREVDNRPPEFARPYEPVKGAKHYSRLMMPKGMLLGLLGLLLIVNRIAKKYGDVNFV